MRFRFEKIYTTYHCKTNLFRCFFVDILANFLGSNRRESFWSLTEIDFQYVPYILCVASVLQSILELIPSNLPMEPGNEVK